jgi:hypothetical protein
MHYTEMTIADLEAETAVALPERQLMSVFNPNWAGIYASSTAVALNASTLLSSATAFSGQSIVVNQL